MALPNTLDNSISFSEDENRQIDDFAKKINIFDTKFILKYGSTLQGQIAELPDLLLKELKDDNSGEVNELIFSLLSELANLTPADTIFTSPSKNRETLSNLRNEYTTISTKVSKLSALLEEQQLIFMQNASMLKRLHEKGLVYYKKLCMFIESGKRKLRSIQDSTTIKNELTISEALNKHSLRNAISRFENRLLELEKSKVLINMFNAQIVLYRKNNNSSLKKIQEIDDITIPAWKKKVKLILRIGDMLELISSLTSSEARELTLNDTSLSSSISSLSDSLKTTTENKKVFDELYLLSKEIKK